MIRSYETDDGEIGNRAQLAFIEVITARLTPKLRRLVAAAPTSSAG